MDEPTRSVIARLNEERLPPYDATHGTPHAMKRRLAEIELLEGSARLEQTDYGHPGRWNAWEPRHVPPKLQPRTAALIAAAEALSALADGDEG